MKLQMIDWKLITSTAFLVLAFLVSMLPSGSVGGTNVKFIAVIIVLLLLIVEFWISGMRRVTVYLVLSGVMSIGIIGIWLILGLHNGNIYAFAQFQSFVVTILLVLIIIAVFVNRPRSARHIIHAIILGNLFYCVIKLVLIGLIYFKIVTFQAFLNIAEFLNTTPITLEIIPRLIRIQTINDVISPFLLFYLLKENYKFKKYNFFLIFIFLLSLFFAYSRALWLLTAIILSIYVFSNIRNEVNRKVVSYLLIFLLVIPIIIYRSGDLFSNRFSSQTSSSSDRTRIVQSIELYDKFSESMVFGHGLGAFVENVIRDEKEPYSYESQWLALLMQIGLLGVSFLCAGIYVGFLYLYKHESKSGWPFVYILWISLPLTNPYMISSISAIVFVLCLLIPTINRRYYEGYNIVGDI